MRNKGCGITVERIKELYYDKKMSHRAIGTYYGCSKGNITSFMRRNNIKPPIRHNNVCGVEGCNCEIYGRFRRQGEYLCSRHYRHRLNYKWIIHNTIKDPNIFVDNGDGSISIVLTDIKHNEVGRALIDKEDLDKVNIYKWHKGSQDYVSNGDKKIRLHRLVMDAPKGMQVDHKDHNTLDNRKSNLRLCSNGQNQQNRATIKGIRSRKNRWQARITANGKCISLGHFKDKEDALKARWAAEKKYFGEFAPNRGVVSNEL